MAFWNNKHGAGEQPVDDMNNGWDDGMNGDTVDTFGEGEGDFAAVTEEELASALPVLKICTPKEFKDAVEIVDLLINGNTIILNLESIHDEQARRLADYIKGAVHVAGGILKSVSKTTVVIAPKNVDVSSIEEMVSNGDGEN